MKRGIFITFEGNDGAGKTTICKLVQESLIQQGYEVIYTREPGGSQIAESIRNILLDVNNTQMDARTEAILYAASRRQHLVEIVQPAIEAGKIVLCDRFIDSSLAYQGVGRDLGIEEVYALNQFAINSLMPDKTIFLSVDIETGAKRMNIRGDKNRLDLEADSFHKKVRQGYETLLTMYPDRIVKVDASGTVPEVFDLTMDEIKKVLKQYE